MGTANRDRHWLFQSEMVFAERRSSDVLKFQQIAVHDYNTSVLGLGYLSLMLISMAYFCSQSLSFPAHFSQH